MRSLTTKLVTIFLALSCLSPGTSADEFTGYLFGSGAWWGAGYNTPPGVFGSCRMEARDAQERFLSISLMNDGSLVIGFSDPALAVRDGAPDKFTIALDDRIERSLYAVKTGQYLAFDLGDDIEFFKALKEARRLSFHMKGKQSVIALYPNTAEVLAELKQCRNFHVQNARVTPSPAPAPSSPPAAAPSPVPAPAPPPASVPVPTPLPAPSTDKSLEELARPVVPEEPRVYASESAYEPLALSLLVQSGYPDPIIMDLQDQPRDFGEIVLGWVGNHGPVGFLGALPAPSGGDYYTDQFVTIVARAALLCGLVGQPKYETMMVSASGAEIYSGSMKCSENGVVAVYFVSSIVDGQVLVFMHFAPESDQVLAKEINTNLRELLRAR